MVVLKTTCLHFLSMAFTLSPVTIRILHVMSVNQIAQLLNCESICAVFQKPPFWEAFLFSAKNILYAVIGGIEALHSDSLFSYTRTWS